MAERLRLKRIERRPKRVHYSVRFQLHAPLSPVKQRTLLGIIRSIENGAGLDESVYRSGVDVDIDHVLGRYGIIHLHLGKGSSELLFLVQYEDHVVLLEVSDHRRFLPPPGKALHESHPAIDTLHDAAVRADEERRAIKTDAVRRGLRKAPPPPDAD